MEVEQGAVNNYSGITGIIQDCLGQIGMFGHPPCKLPKSLPDVPKCELLLPAVVDSTLDLETGDLGSRPYSSHTSGMAFDRSMSFLNSVSTFLLEKNLEA